MAHTFMAGSDREKLREQFLNQPAETHTRHWDDLWKREVTPWDRAGPSLALEDALTAHTDLVGSPLQSSSSRQRKRALVPGCGRGYDVLLLSAMGYDCYGLDASETAIAAARKLEISSRDDEKYASSNPELGRGTVTFLLHDFFKDDFQAETNGADFDLIFDYTFLCALPPEMRPNWAKRMSELLAPSGSLVCLEWPLGKDPKTGGPPHGLTSELYIELFKRPGAEVAYDERGVVHTDDVAASAGLNRAAYFRPQRTHEAGKGKDYVSIWKHRQ